MSLQLIDPTGGAGTRADDLANIGGGVDEDHWAQKSIVIIRDAADEVHRLIAHGMPSFLAHAAARGTRWGGEAPRLNQSIPKTLGHGEGSAKGQQLLESDH